VGWLVGKGDGTCVGCGDDCWALDKRVKLTKTWSIRTILEVLTETPDKFS
jgi:hypothetical protein